MLTWWNAVNLARRSTMPQFRVCLPVAQYFGAWTRKEPGNPFRTGKVAQKWHSEIILRQKARLFLDSKRWI